MQQNYFELSNVKQQSISCKSRSHWLHFAELLKGQLLCSLRRSEYTDMCLEMYDFTLKKMSWNVSLEFRRGSKSFIQFI